MATTLAQQKAVAIAPKFTAFASAVGSATTCFLILRRTRSSRSKANKRTYHRLVLGMSLTDFSASVAWFCTTWPIPKGTPGVYGAVGTQQTCSAQAFFAQFSLSTVMYNASLALYYVLVIVKGWKDEEIVKVEVFFHLHALAWGLGTAIASLALTLFNQVGWDCWISSAPLGCKESWKNNGETTCTRGDNGSLYQWAFYYAPLWFVIALVSGLMYWVYHTVRAQEKRMERYQPGNDEAKLRQLRLSQTQVSNYKRIQRQALYYVGAFLVAWFFPTIFQLVIVTTQTFPFPLLFLTAFFVPIQGLLNLIVFIRPKYMRYRKAHPEEWFLPSWFRMLWLELIQARGSGGQTTTGPSTNSSKPGFGSERSFRLTYLKRKASDLKRKLSWQMSDSSNSEDEMLEEEEELAPVSVNMPHVNKRASDVETSEEEKVEVDREQVRASGKALASERDEFVENKLPNEPAGNV